MATHQGRPESSVRVRPGLEDVVAYGAPQLDVPYRMNTNETPEPPPARFLEEVAVRMRGAQLHRYPDRDHIALRERLADRVGASVGQVWAANGSNEVLIQLLQAYGGPKRQALVFRPSYSMYPELCRTACTPVATVDLNDRLELTAQIAAQATAELDPSIVLVGSPNNPVGNALDLDVVRTLHDESRAIVVVDEAYVEFAPSAASALGLLAELDRLVVVRTFSKAFRLAGLRLGYLIAPAWVVDDVQKVRLPYHLDSIKQIAATVALEQEEEFLDHRAQIAAERQRVAAALEALDDVAPYPSTANFILFRTPVADLFDRLLAHGVLIRDFSKMPRLEGCVRVTIGTPAENDAFLDALATVLGDARR